MGLNIQLFISPPRKGDNIMYDISTYLKNKNTILTQLILKDTSNKTISMSINPIVR